LSIGALAHATDIPVETLRTWERRYGYPRPERKPSGHRVYPVSSIPRLRRIAEVLARGHRAGEVVSAGDTTLQALLDASSAPLPPTPTLPASATLDPQPMLEIVERFDAEALTRALLAEWGRLGPLDFLQDRVAPLVHAVGVAWETGRLEIRHEHFLSERLGDLLRSLRLPFEQRATGPLIVLATMPGETHAIGLQMAALVLATAGWRVLILGTEVPLDELATIAGDMKAQALGISVSVATGGSAGKRRLSHLRGILPRRVALLVGGESDLAALPGITRIRDLATLERWSRQTARAG
jgi:methanogenic corrinoid protein MtbC1